MSMVGTYHSPEINATFTVTEANDRNGDGAGKIEIGDVTIAVKIHYHFEKNVGPITDLWFAGNQEDPNLYVAGVGKTNNQGFPTIRIAGGYPTSGDVNTFEGTFHRQ